MGTLEVHDPEGRVQFVMLSEEHPVIFGTSSTCDVVVDGPGILPVQGRIRWRKTRYRVEASPDAEFVLVNGNRMASASLKPGDEIVVGDWKIFMLDRDVEDRSADRELADQDRTQVQSPPRIQERADAKTGAGKARASGKSRKPAKAKTATTSSKLESDDWLEILDKDDEEDEQDDLIDDKALATALFPESVGSEKRLQTPDQPGFLGRLFGKRARRKTDRATAPGEEPLLSSPLVLGLFASFAVLVLLGITIYTVLMQTMATRLYNHAVEALDNGDYRNSIRNFDAFLQSNPEDLRVGKVRTLRGLASVRQFVSPSGSQWTNALEASRRMFEELRDVPEFGDERTELGELLIRIGEGLADRARSGADRKALGEAESVLPLLSEVSGEGAKAAIGRSNLPAKLNEARAAIRKAEIRLTALATMDEALKAGSSRRVYAARDNLIGQYGDLANDRELLKRMVEANELVRKAVKVSTDRKPGETSPRPEPLGPPVGLVFRTSKSPVPSPPIAENIIFALADGFAFGFDGSTGAPLWQRPVGLASPFPPRGVPSDPSCLVVDSRHQDLVRLNSITGELIWRQPLGELVDDPPLVLGNQLVQVLPSGRLLVLALDSGDIQATVDVGFPLSRAPIADESGRNLYLLARRDCLLVLSRDPLACVSVEYLGHADGSIPCAPSRLGRFLIVPENHSLNDGRWRIFVLDPEGTHVKPVQEIPIAGWTWAPPPISGAVVWSASDRGTLEAFAAGDYTSTKPFKSVSRLDGELGDNGPSYALARSERELWVASMHAGRFDLEAERGVLTPRFGLSQSGPALAPIQTSGTNLVFTFQDPVTSGTAIWAVDPETGKPVWRTILGVPWLTPPRKAGDGQDGPLVTLGLDGRPAEIPPALLESGGILSLALPESGSFELPSEPYRWLKIGGKDVLVSYQETKSVWVRDPNGNTGRPWRQTDLPSSIAATPLAWGGGLLIPGADARIYIVDPVSSRSIIEPFVPVYDRDRPSNWLAPAVIDAENLIIADREGRVRRLALRGPSGARLLAEAERTLDQKPVASPVATSQTVVIATADRKVRVLAARDLSPIGSWDHRGGISSIPSPSEGRIFIPDDTGGVLALASDGRRLWSIELESTIVGAPLVRGKTVWFLTIDGTLHGRDAESGESRAKIELHVLPSGGPIADVDDKGDRLIIPVARGTYQTLRIPNEGERKP